MTYTPQDPCTPHCPNGRHFHIEDPTDDNAWALDATRDELPHGAFGARVESHDGEPLTPEQSLAKASELFATPKRLVPIG